MREFQQYRRDQQPRSLAEQLRLAMESVRLELPQEREVTEKEKRMTIQEREKRAHLLAIVELIAAGKNPNELTTEERALADIEKTEQGFWKIPVSNHFFEERLPAGYGYKGGAARALLIRSTEIDPSYIPRDIDIIRLAEEEPEAGLDDQLAEKFMPDDFENGHGVESIDDVDEYLATRDFTMNELYATDDAIYATDQCLRDTLRGIVRVSTYERKQYYGSIGPKILAKMLRFYAEGMNRGFDISIEKEGTYQLENYSISAFWMALNLEKAAEVSAGVATQYLEELKRIEQVPENIETVEELTHYLGSLMMDKPFYFRYAPSEDFRAEEEEAKAYAEEEDVPSFAIEPVDIPKPEHS